MQCHPTHTDAKLPRSDDDSIHLATMYCLAPTRARSAHRFNCLYRRRVQRVLDALLAVERTHAESVRHG